MPELLLLGGQWGSPCSMLEGEAVTLQVLPQGQGRALRSAEACINYACQVKLNHALMIANSWLYKASSLLRLWEMANNVELLPSLINVALRCLNSWAA